MLTKEIEQILTSKGRVRSSSSIGIGVEPAGCLDAGQEHPGGHVEYMYQNMVLKTGGGAILLNRVADRADAATYNCVNVITTTNRACMGPVRTPGYVYTDNFSGCVFYLYQDNGRQVIGVHAHQGLDTVQTKVHYGPFKLRSKYINAEVRKEYGPSQYMALKTKLQLARHETRGEMNTAETGATKHYMAFLSCVELDSATTFLFVYKPLSANENEVVRLVHKFVDAF